MSSRRFLLAILISAAAGAAFAGESDKATGVVVLKAERRLEIRAGATVLKTYGIVLGGTPVGPKREEGDGKTPEGRYVLDWRNPNSGYYKSLHISYPSTADEAAAAAAGRKPGGMIMIHGQRNYFNLAAPLTQLFDWTDGCVAVTDAEMDEIWSLVPNGTPIEIKP